MKHKPVAGAQINQIAWASIAVILLLLLLYPDAALAQADPTAKDKACQAQAGLRQLAGALGAVGMVACLMLGFFNKLNWKWLSTGIGVCFAINLVPSIISFVSGSASC